MIYKIVDRLMQIAKDNEDAELMLGSAELAWCSFSYRSIVHPTSSGVCLSIRVAQGFGIQD